MIAKYQSRGKFNYKYGDEGSIQLLELPDLELFDSLLAVKESEKKEFSRVIAKIRHAATAQG